MSKPRKTGIDVLGDIPWGSHFCLFYETKQDLLDIVVPHFKAGFENNEFCIWVISGSRLTTAEEARAALEQAVPGLDRLLADDRIEILNTLDWYLEENEFNIEKIVKALDAKLKRALAQGYDGMRVSGDMFWLEQKYRNDFNAYEKHLHDFITDLPMTVLCTYPLAGFGSTEILDVMQVHQFAIIRRQGEWEVIETPELIEARAEIKRLNEELQRVKERTPKPPVILNYVAAVLSITTALIVAQILGVHLATAPVSLFLCAIMFSAWYGGVKPGLLAMALSLLAFKFYFVDPVYSWTIEIREIPRLLIFALSSLFAVLLVAAQKSTAESLRRAHGVLHATVRKLRQTNAALRMEIIERKQAEDELRLAYQRLSYHVENTPLAVIEFDKDMYIKRWAGHAEEIFGWKASEALGKNVYDPDFHFVYEEDIPAVDKINDQLTKGIVNRNLSLNRNYTKDGNLIYCEWHNSVLRDEHKNVITILSLVHDVTERKKTEQTLNRSYEEIRQLTNHLQKIREEERAHIAREIHDELGQQLTVLRMDIMGLNKKLNSSDETIKQKIGDIINLLDTTVKSVRRISSELRPSLLHNLGLAAAIEWHLKEFEKRSGIKIIFHEPGEELKIPDSIKNGLFRIFQESLTNASRHANATKIIVTLDQKDQQLILSIEDDGQGFEKEKINAKQTLGILGMKERSQMMGGNYEIRSTPGKGTTVLVAIPCNEKEQP